MAILMKPAKGPRNPCNDCEADGKQTEANYANEQGDKDKLCAKHTKAKGLSTLRNPCCADWLEAIPKAPSTQRAGSPLAAAERLYVPTARTCVMW